MIIMKMENNFGAIYVINMVNLGMELIVVQNVHMISMKNVLKNCLYAINVMKKDNLKMMLMSVHNVNMLCMKNAQSNVNIIYIKNVQKEEILTTLKF